MKIKELYIKNFRSFKEGTINFSEYNCLLGANGAGKSTILQALDLFFSGSNNKINEGDFHNKNIAEPIIIKITFDSLSSAEQLELKNYYRSGKLIVGVKIHWATNKGVYKQYGVRKIIKDFTPFFEKGENSKDKSATELQDIYTKLKTQGQYNSLLDW